ncbi:Phosphotransferase enzyme family protein [Candidatus Rubidus massiliensis]|nr:Phosphotransferase enzyme family protein [Candidatus Rubidus massiliensis]
MHNLQTLLNKSSVPNIEVISSQIIKENILTKTLIVETNIAKFAVKIFSIFCLCVLFKKTKEEILEFGNLNEAALQVLISNQLRIPSNFKFRNRHIVDDNGELYIFYEFLPGVIKDGEDYSLEMIKKVSKGLKKIHSVNYKIYPKSFWELKYQTFCNFMNAAINQAESKEVQQIFTNANLGDYVQNTIKQGREIYNTPANFLDEFCLIHGDYRPKNILWDKESFSVIDWEVYAVNHRSYEVLNSLLGFGMHESQDPFVLDKTKAITFFKTYNEGLDKPVQFERQDLSMVVNNFIHWMVSNYAQKNKVEVDYSLNAIKCIQENQEFLLSLR